MNNIVVKAKTTPMIIFKTITTATAEADLILCCAAHNGCCQPRRTALALLHSFFVGVPLRLTTKGSTEEDDAEQRGPWKGHSGIADPRKDDMEQVTAVRGCEGAIRLGTGGHRGIPRKQLDAW